MRRSALQQSPLLFQLLVHFALRLLILIQQLLHQPPVLAGGGTFFLFKDADEVGEVVEAAAEANLRHRVTGLGEHLARLADAQVDEVFDEADPCLALEEVAEGGLRHIDAGSHVAQMDGLLEVLVNIIAYLRDAPALGDAYNGLRVVDMLHQLPLCGDRKQVQYLQKLDHRLEAALRGEVEEPGADIKNGGLREAKTMLRVEEQLLDGLEESFLQHRKMEYLVGELDGDHMVALHHLTLPRVWDMGTDHHQVER